MTENSPRQEDADDTSPKREDAEGPREEAERPREEYASLFRPLRTPVSMPLSAPSCLEDPTERGDDDPPMMGASEPNLGSRRASAHGTNNGKSVSGPVWCYIFQAQSG